MNDRCVTDGFDAAVGKETSDEDLVDIIKMIHGIRGSVSNSV